MGMASLLNFTDFADVTFIFSDTLTIFIWK